MNNNEIKIPPFVQDYINKVDGNGLSDFVKISAEYQKEKDNYPGKYTVQLEHLNNFNRRTGQNKTLNYEDGLNGIDANYKQRAYQTAKQHGFKGPDPSQPSDKEFTKQGEKFQGMINQAKQRQEETKSQGQDKQETAKGKETESIKNKGAEQQPSGTDEQSQEQKRAAFLEQAKKITEQQTQSQQSNRHQI